MVGISLLTLVPGISGGSETYARELVRALGRVGELDYRVFLPTIATDVEGEDLGVVGIPANAVLAVGNERRGVRDWLPRWDRAIRIRQRPATESLNAAVAGSIVLYEAMRCQDPCQVAEKP